MESYNEGLRELEEKEFLSDDSDVSYDSLDYNINYDKVEKNMSKINENICHLNERFGLKFKLSKICLKCKIVRIPFSQHCGRCKG